MKPAFEDAGHRKSAEECGTVLCGGKGLQASRADPIKQYGPENFAAYPAGFSGLFCLLLSLYSEQR